MSEPNKLLDGASRPEVALAKHRPWNASEGEVTGADAIRFVTRHWKWILFPGLAAALLAWVVAGFLAPSEYEARATLLVVQPNVASELNQTTLSVYGYKTLLESDAIVIETQRRLAERGVIGESEADSRLARRIEARIFVSRRQETVSLSPMITVLARWDDAEDAAQIANVWIEVFLEHTRELMRGATEVDLKLVEEQYPQISKDLEVEEGKWVEKANEYQVRLQNVATKGDRRLATFKKQTSSLVSAYNAESRSLIEELVTSGIRRIQASGALAVSSSLEEKLYQLASIRSQMAESAPVLNLEKAITDNALWQALMAESAELDSLGDLSLLTQEINPVYSELSVRAIELEVELRREIGLTEQAELELLRKLEELQQERSTNLAKLRIDRGVETAVLIRLRDREMGALVRERDAALAQSRRSIDQLASLEAELRGNYAQAILARAQEDVEGIRLAAPAVPVNTPEPKWAAPKAAAAFVVGALFGIVFAAVQDVRSHDRR